MFSIIYLSSDVFALLIFFSIALEKALRASEKFENYCCRPSLTATLARTSEPSLYAKRQDANVASAKEEAEANLRELENVRGQLEQDRETALRELEEQKQRFGIPDHVWSCRY